MKYRSAFIPLTTELVLNSFPFYPNHPYSCGTLTHSGEEIPQVATTALEKKGKNGQ